MLKNILFSLIQVFLNSQCQIVFPLLLYCLVESLKVKRKKMYTKEEHFTMTQLPLGEKKTLPFLQHLCQSHSLRNCKEKGALFPTDI